MRIAVLANQYGALSETFTRREVIALQSRHHECAVFVGCPAGGPLPAVSSVPIADWTDAAIRAFDPDVLYATLGMRAHRRALQVASATNIPVCFRLWSGYDMFATPSPEFYEQATRHRLCIGAIVEDDFCSLYAREAMRCDPSKLHAVPNGIDVELFRPREGERTPGPIRVLAVARMVKKKGLLGLVRAMRDLPAGAATLTLVGYGMMEAQLKAAATDNVTFLPPVPESELPALYQSHDIFAAPCVRSPNGDGDGIPTTVLEAMSCGLAVVVSDLLSAREYERVWLLPPGDDAALTRALRRLVEHPKDRQDAGARVRAFALQHLDIRKNIQRIEAVLQPGARHERWQRGMEAIMAARQNRTPSLTSAYDRMADEALEFWDISGDVLDVGCGNGWMKNKLRDRVASYLGIEAEAHYWADYILVGTAEALPSDDCSFDSVVCNSVLQHVEHPDKVLAEIHRVLKLGGKFAVNICVDDPNPNFMSWWSKDEALGMLDRAGFRVVGFKVLGQRHLYVNAVKV